MNDLFESNANQLGFDLGDDQGPRSYEPDRAEIREELSQILATAKAASAQAPWDERTFKYHKVVFPQMARWLPDEELDRLCFEFAREIERIALLMAA